MFPSRFAMYEPLLIRMPARMSIKKLADLTQPQRDRLAFVELSARVSSVGAGSGSVTAC